MIAETNSDDFNFSKVFLSLWKGRKFIFFISLIFTFSGGIIGFLTPVTFTANNAFLPQSSEVGSMGGNLGGLAALAGISLNSSSAGGEIPPSLYFKILQSEPYSTKILNSKIWFDGNEMTIREYFQSIPPSKLDIVKEYSLGLPSKIIGYLKSLILNIFKRDSRNEIVNNPTFLTGELKLISDLEYGFQSLVLEKISISYDKQDGLVSIKAVDSNPIVAAQLANIAQVVLQEWITDYKVKSTKSQFDFIDEQLKIKEEEFFNIQKQLSNYMDKNQNVISSKYLIDFERLQQEFDLANSIYSELKKQRETVMIQLSKRTPSFIVLDSTEVPRNKTGPNYFIYIFIGFTIGIVLAITLIFTKVIYNEYFKTEISII